MTDFDRYRKQMLVAGIGEEGQHRLSAARVLLCGVGATGSLLADALVRTGVGFLRIADRDFVEVSNLQRQSLYTEADVASHLPKAIAAAERLRAINSQVLIEPHVVDVRADTVRDLCDGVDLILDGSDNFELRYLLNDASLEFGIPWVYTGVIGSHGQTMPIFPNESACLRCLMPDMPPEGSTETCDTAGVLGPAIGVLGSFAAATALKILTGNADLAKPELVVVDVWETSLRTLDMSTLRDAVDCPACKRDERLWLEGRVGSQTHVLCGRNAVQISPAEPRALVLEDVAARLRSSGDVRSNAYLLRLTLREPECELTIFPDARMIVQGTDDPGVARSLYARYVGS